ncbi:MAG: PAS domain S-box protein [Fimbriimonadaceae bacterium]|nr:PAS domain S-box protein [Fimbriimonadaceae bacterium]QYK54956.1 MAG: PAS domain S-box protein [Fimbriimonadaceae bacterium]
MDSDGGSSPTSSQLEWSYRQLADALPHLVWLARADGAVLYYNQRVRGYGGTVENEAGSRRWEAVVHPDDVDYTGEAWQRSVEQDVPYECEHRMLMADGTFRWHISRAERHQSPDGESVWFGTATDIHDRKLLEIRLRDSEQKFRAKFYNAAVGMAHVSLDGRWQLVNDRLCEILGYSREELLQMSFADITHPDDLDSDLEQTRKLLDGSISTYSIEKRYYRKDGRLIWVSLTGSLVCKGDGTSDYVLGITQDITDRKQAEAARALSDQRFHLMADNISQFAWIADANGWIFWYNKRWYEYTGTTLKDVQGWGWRAVQHPDHVERVVAKISEHWKSGEPWEDTFPIKGKDGDYRWFLSRALPIRGNDGSVIQWFGTHTDITQHLELQSALQESEQKFKTMADTAPAMLWITDAANHCTFLSRGWFQFTGQVDNGELDRLWKEAIQSDDRELFVKTVEDFGKSNLPFDQDFRVIRYDGAERWAAFSGRPRFGPAGEFLGFIGSIIDIHERKTAEGELERLYESERCARTEAERASRLKDEFLATLSHELRTPMSPILGWSDILSQSIGAVDSETLSEGLSAILKAARAQMQLIEDLLDMSRVVSEKIVLQNRPVDLEKLAVAAMDMVRVAASQQNIRLTFRSESLPPVTGDFDRLRQVLWNLLTNSIKFSPPGSEVVLEVRRNGNWAEIIVADCGIGIRPEFIPYVFDRFRQETASANRSHGGLGIGLSLVKSLTELHGGTVEVASEGEGKGATFTVRLPLAGKRACDDPMVDVAENVDVDLSGREILLVEDDAATGDIIGRTLERAGAVITRAGTVDDALRSLEERRFDILISDIGMPGKDGFDLIKSAKRLAPDIPSVALTAYASASDAEQALREGFSFHIAKPVTSADLVNTVARILKQHAEPSDFL